MGVVHAVVLSKNSIETFRRADFPLEVRRTGPLGGLRSLLRSPECVRFPKRCSSSSWPWPGGSTSSSVTSSTTSRKKPRPARAASSSTIADERRSGAYEPARRSPMQRYFGSPTSEGRLGTKIVDRRSGGQRFRSTVKPTRQRERQMRRFKSAAHAQRFLSVHGLVQNLFRVGRHLLRAVHHRSLRTRSFRVWDEVTCAC